MTDLSWSHSHPRTILLATDLSSRCDRAMDRAAQLASLWAARLIVLNVLEQDQQVLDRRQMADLPSWRQSPDRQAVVAAQVRRDLREDLKAVEVRVVDGVAASTIDEVAREVGADLIVIGIARDETFGRYFLGSTVERLSRQTPVPLLIVKSRLRPYREVLIATDFSPPSQHALTAASRFFPTVPLTLLHAWEVPFAGFLDKPQFRSELGQLEKEACNEFVSQSQLSEQQRRDLRVLVEHGNPEMMVRAYMQDGNVDLVVVGTHGRSGLFDIRLGGTAKRILDTAPGDVLLIREPSSVRSSSDQANRNNVRKN